MTSIKDTFRNRGRPLFFDVAAGLLGTNVTSINKFGENPDIDTGSGFEDIWDLGGGYTFSSTGVIYFISSDNAGDTETIEVQGLDENFVEQTIQVTLVGQTKTQIGTGEKFIRVFRMKNIGTSDLVGVSYCYEDDTVTAGVPDTATKIRAVINNGNNQTLMAIYTVPVGKTGFIIAWWSALSKKQTAFSVIQLKVRPFGQVFQIKQSNVLASTGSSHIHHTFLLPEVVAEKSDIVLRADASANDTGVVGGFDMVLVDNDLLN